MHCCRQGAHPLWPLAWAAHAGAGSEVTTLLAVVLPLFAGVATVVLRFFAQNRHSIAKGRPVTGTYVALVWLFAVAFTITVMWVIVGRAMFVYWSCDRGASNGSWFGCISHPRLNRIGHMVK